MPITGNKGEWSEFYAFLKVLDERKLFFADENLNKQENSFLPVTSVVREETGAIKKTYKFLESGVGVFGRDDVELGIVDIDKIRNGVVRVFDKIKNSGATFSVEVADELMRDLKCSQIRAGNENKEDIMIAVKERETSSDIELGFSIKSMMGSPATLLNSSQATNLIYKIENFTGDYLSINHIEGRAKIRRRLQAIEDGGGKVIFKSAENQIFSENLKTIDSAFDRILAALIKLYYTDKGADMDTLCDILLEDEELRADFGLSRSHYEFKIKIFLRAVALGMVPNSPWNGRNSAHGGYLIVKDNGEVVCYHLYKLDDFQDYLFKNTKFDTASSKRHKFGIIYEDNGELFIKLNVQIRFVE